MNVKKQVCTREQGEILKAMGVVKNGHCFSWYYDKLNSRFDISHLCVEALGIIATTNGEINIAVPAFTVAELGQMITTSFDLPYPNGMVATNDKLWISDLIGINFKTEAETRADLLIYLLKNGDIDIDYCNEMMK